MSKFYRKRKKKLRQVIDENQQHNAQLLQKTDQLKAQLDALNAAIIEKEKEIDTLNQNYTNELGEKEKIITQNELQLQKLEESISRSKRTT